MESVVLRNEFNEYPDIISYDEKNPTLTSPYSDTDCPFYMTKEMLIDVDLFRSFVKNAEASFRASHEYKLYKSYLIEYLGMNRCQVFGNITNEDAKNIGKVFYLNCEAKDLCEELYNSSLIKWKINDSCVDDITAIVIYF